jgi:hypothetical protein
LFAFVAALVELSPDEAILWLVARFLLQLPELWNRSWRVLGNAGCSLASHGVLVTDSRSQMGRHLRQHLEKGDNVSQEVFWELQEEMKQLGDAVASQ